MRSGPFTQKTLIYQTSFLQLVLYIIQQTRDKTYFTALHHSKKGRREIFKKKMTVTAQKVQNCIPWSRGIDLGSQTGQNITVAGRTGSRSADHRTGKTDQGCWCMGKKLFLSWLTWHYCSVVNSLALQMFCCRMGDDAAGCHLWYGWVVSLLESRHKSTGDPFWVG